VDFSWPAEADDVYARIAGDPAGWTVAADGHFYAPEQWRRCGDAGLLGLSVPVRYGGRGYGFLTTARAAEAFGLVCADFGLVFASMAHLFACAMPIAEFGCQPLAARILPRLSSGEWVGANAITEETAGSDVTAIQTRAVPDGDGYRITGTKVFVTNGPNADVFVVYARTDPAAGHLGLTAFVVERGSAGLSVGRPLDKSVLTSCPASTVTLVDCFVPARCRLGREGQGAMIFQAAMRWERTCLFAAYLGQMSRVLDSCVRHARQRRQFGRRIGSNQAVSHRLAQLRLRLEAARLLLCRACWRLDRGEAARMDTAMAKLAVSETAVELSLAAVHLFGARGVLVETGIERELRNALPSTIFSGTSEMQLELIAQEMGL
jgi:alkylation response protein AidB-like acyl-CoA dehydrogenase